MHLNVQAAEAAQWAFLMVLLGVLAISHKTEVHIILMRMLR
jgi:hypothetical protein